MTGLIRTLATKVSRRTARHKSALVNFVLCGTQKGGTSALDAYLREHPEICMAATKEVHFFDNERLYQKGRPDVSKYHVNFSPNPAHRAIGEATPIYMYWHEAARRMWEYNPDLKLLITLRNPIERAYSHWNMERSRNAEPLSFWEAIQKEPERCREALPHQHRTYSYLDRGFYSEQLRRLWHFFGRRRVHIVTSDQLRMQPQEALNGIFDFLQVTRLKVAGPKEVHSRSYDSDMTGREKEYLRNVFEPEIRNLERLLDWNCSAWLAD